MDHETLKHMDYIRTILARIMNAKEFWRGRKDVVQVVRNRDGRWEWRRKSPDGDPVAMSDPFFFASRKECLDNLERTGWVFGGHELIDESRRKP